MPARPALTCPRCGYDLSGVAATIPLARNGSVSGEADGAACPLDCTCSECGGVFAWSRVLSGAVEWPGWFVESPRDRRGWFGALRTLWRVLRPGKFWREIGFDKPVRGHRLVWWMTAMMLVPAALLGVPHYAVMVWNWYIVPTGTPLPTAAQNEFFALRDVALIFAEVFASGNGAVWIGPSVALCAMMAFMLAILPSVRVGLTTRAAFALRAATYSLAWLPAIILLSATGRVCAGLDVASFLESGTSSWRWSPLSPQKRVQVMADEWLPTVFVFRLGSGNTAAAELIWLCLVMAWLAHYWHRAIREGAHTAQPRLIFAACIIPSALLALVVFVLHDCVLVPVLR